MKRHVCRKGSFVGKLLNIETLEKIPDFSKKKDGNSYTVKEINKSKSSYVRIVPRAIALLE